MAWDSGVDALTATWAFQDEPGRVNVIDYYGQGLQHYVEWLNGHHYSIGVDWVPYDARVREFGSGRTRIEAMLALGRKPASTPLGRQRCAPL
jgi:phage terminase large subunit